MDCSYCQRSFEQKKQFFNHLNSCSKAPSSLKTCRQCSKTYSTINMFRRHVCHPNESTVNEHQPDNDQPNLTDHGEPSKRSRTLRIDTAIDELGDNISPLIDLISNPSRVWNDKKDAWVIRLTESFSERIPAILRGNEEFEALYEDGILDIWNNPDTMRFFLLFLSKIVHHCAGTIRDVIIPSLKRIFKKKFNTSFNEEMIEMMNSTIREIVRESAYSPLAKAPASISDVAKIISEIPSSRSDKVQEAALFLIAVTVGARAMTMEGIALEDILQVIKNESRNTIIVKLRLKKTKGKPQWNHEVTIEGSILNESPTDAVYYLNQWLKKKINMDLTTFSNEFNGDMSTSLFDFSKDAMRERWKIAAIKAGYPPLFFSFHSLRSGFICSSLLNAQKTGSNLPRQAVLELTAFIGGWRVGGRAQIAYVKECAMGSIIASRVTSGDTDGYVDEIMLKPEIFHGITLGPNLWTTKEIMICFSNIIKAKLAEKCNTKVFIEACYAKILREWSAKNREKYQRIIGRKTFKNTETLCRFVLHQVLTDQNVDNMAEKAYELLKEDYVQKMMDLYSQRTGKTYDEKIIQRQKHHSGARQRKKWTEEEDAILTEGCRILGNKWSEISKKLKDRTATDCKDRMRNITKKRNRQ